ncbi:MAG: hypothetical protein GY696_10910 [Gammaproteobacteria bacterium]|nr:hypothetical protein [Gammaproteobacteria bacterium]
MSCVSLIVTVTVAVFTLRLKTMRSQFAYLCVSLAAADCGVLAIFAFWTVPMTFTQNVVLATGFVGKKIGQIRYCHCKL